MARLGLVLRAVAPGSGLGWAAEGLMSLKVSTVLNQAGGMVGAWVFGAGMGTEVVGVGLGPGVILPEV
eukprot:scaffold19531_cov44-Prasinocladus_malaysianus.AAC.1